MVIDIVVYNPAWAEEFQQLASKLRQILGESALRINHIGSTAVPGLAAKDCIDIQVAVAALDPTIEATLAAHGYERIVTIQRDHRPPTATGPESDWEKRLFRFPAGTRPANFHMRVLGAPNQRYAVLFRDYLRATPLAAQAYAQVKVALANKDNEDVEFYYTVKDPVCDIIMAGAELWAQNCGWQIPETDA